MIERKGKDRNEKLDTEELKKKKEDKKEDSAVKIKDLVVKRKDSQI